MCGAFSFARDCGETARKTRAPAADANLDIVHILNIVEMTPARATRDLRDTSGVTAALRRRGRDRGCR